MSLQTNISRHMEQISSSVEPVCWTSMLLLRGLNSPLSILLGFLLRSVSLLHSLGSGRSFVADNCLGVSKMPTFSFRFGTIHLPGPPSRFSSASLHLSWPATVPSKQACRRNQQDAFLRMKILERTHHKTESTTNMNIKTGAKIHRSRPPVTALESPDPSFCEVLLTTRGPCQICGSQISDVMIRVAPTASGAIIGVSVRSQIRG